MQAVRVRQRPFYRKTRSDFRKVEARAPRGDRGGPEQQGHAGIFFPGCLHGDKRRPRTIWSYQTRESISRDASVRLIQLQHCSHHTEETQDIIWACSGMVQLTYFCGLLNWYKAGGYESFEDIRADCRYLVILLVASAQYWTPGAENELKTPLLSAFRALQRTYLNL
jgi:hypothetical protein